MSRFQVEGSELKKVRTNSRVYQRYYLLDAGLQALCWEPSKKESDKARISLGSIREVSAPAKALIASFMLMPLEQGEGDIYDPQPYGRQQSICFYCI